MTSRVLWYGPPFKEKFLSVLGRPNVNYFILGVDKSFLRRSVERSKTQVTFSYFIPNHEIFIIPPLRT